MKVVIVPVQINTMQIHCQKYYDLGPNPPAYSCTPNLHIVEWVSSLFYPYLKVVTTFQQPRLLIKLHLPLNDFSLNLQASFCTQFLHNSEPKFACLKLTTLIYEGRNNNMTNQLLTNLHIYHLKCYDLDTNSSADYCTPFLHYLEWV